MPKVEEIDDHTQDEDYNQEVFSACCLTMTERWKHKQYILTVLVPDIMTDRHKYNIMATHLNNAPKSDQPRGAGHEGFARHPYQKLNDTRRNVHHS